MNPFLKEPLKVVNVKETHFRIRPTKMPENGVITDMTSVDEIKRTYLAERRGKTSVFHNPYRVEFLNFMTKSSMKLYMWIALHLERNTDVIKMNHTKVGKALKFSSTKTFYNAVENLNDLTIICKKDTGEYWVNPKYLFNGDRIHFYKHNGEIDIVSNVEKQRY